METKKMDAVRHEERNTEEPSTQVRVGRRKFSAEYKRRILTEAASCKHGELGLMLRREGLYASTLESWRKKQNSESKEGLQGKRRGRKPSSSISGLQRENQRLLERLKQAELIIDIQKKLCTMLGLTPAETAL